MTAELVKNLIDFYHLRGVFVCFNRLNPYFFSLFPELHVIEQTYQQSVGRGNFYQNLLSGDFRQMQNHSRSHYDMVAFENGNRLIFLDI